MFSNLKFKVLKMTLKLLEVSKIHDIPLDDLILFLAHFRWGGEEGGGYNSLSLWMVEDKSYGNCNP